MASTLKTFTLALLSLLLGSLLTEGFLRTLVPVELQFETWFTPGIERYDEQFGALYKADWSGWMRHRDGVYRGVPLQLDENGFRQSARNLLPGEPKRILLMGGRSAMMSYGLTDQEAIPTRMVAHAPFAMEVQSISSAGGTLIRDWNLYRQKLLNERWDLVIVSHVNPYLAAFQDHDAFDTVPTPASEAWVFRYLDGIQLWRDGLFQKIGRPAFRSYLGYGLIRLVDSSIKEVERLNGAPAGGLAAVIRKQAAAPGEQALEDYTAFLKHLENHFESRGIPMVLNFIPRPYAERNHHAPYRDQLAKTFEVVDLQLRLYDQLQPTAFIANGHYDRELADAIGNALEEEVSTRLLPASP